MGLFQILDDLIGMVHRHRPCGRNAQHDAQHHNASDGDGVAGFFKEGEAPLTRLASVPQAKIFARFVDGRSEEHTSELQSLMRISYAVFCLKKKKRILNTKKKHISIL